MPLIKNLYKRMSAKEWSEWRWGYSFSGVENLLFARISQQRDQKPQGGAHFLTLEYYRGSARPGSNEVIHVKLRKRKSARFELFSSFLLLCG